jgi:hypothetical protein
MHGAGPPGSAPLLDDRRTSRHRRVMTGPVGVEVLHPSEFAAEPLPEEFSPSRLRRSVLALVLILVAVVAAVMLLPGLGSLRDRFSGAQAGWLIVAVGLDE